MTNFPGLELFSGDLIWRAASDEGLQLANGTIEGKTTDWPQELLGSGRRGITANAIFTGMLFRSVHSAELSSFLRVEITTQEARVELGSKADLGRIVGEHVLADALLPVVDENRRSWELIGLAPNVVLGAIATQGWLSPCGYGDGDWGHVTISIRPFNEEEATKIRVATSQ